MQSHQSDTLFLHILGTAAIVLYYGVVVYVGVWASQSEDDDEDAAPQDQQLKVGSPRGTETAEASKHYLLRLFLANRGLPLSLGFISMTATWVGAGYINGTAEAVFNDGLVWCQAPLGYALSLVVGGLFFASRMRETRALTMLDPFQQFYGPWIAVLLCVPAICGEVFWTASNLSALGDTVSTVAYLNKTFIIIASTVVIMFYTSAGGLTSVMYTDAFQLGITVFGLWCCVPFIVWNSTPADVSDAKKDWLGVIEDRDVSQIFDQLFMTIFGGIPWQVYFQRVLSSDSAFSAKMLSYLSAVGCVFLALPPIIVGAAAKGANFTASGYPGPYNLEPDHRNYVIPNAVRYLTPSLVSILGQLAISAAVMSSVDSSMLSASSLITRNVYQRLLNPTMSQEDVCRVLRGSIWGIGLLAMAMALKVQSVFVLWTLSSDLMYVLLFPQFVALFFLRDWSNAYGAVFGFLVGFVMRALCGEPEMGIPVLLRLPQYDRQRGQQFPFRTMCMLISLCAHLGASGLAACAFRSRLLDPNRDVWGCFWEISDASPALVPAVDSSILPSSATNAAATNGKARGLQEPSRDEAGSVQEGGAPRPGAVGEEAAPSETRTVDKDPNTATLPLENLEGDPTPEKTKRPIVVDEGPTAESPVTVDTNANEAKNLRKAPADKAEDKRKADKPVRRPSVSSKGSGGSKTRRASVVGSQSKASTSQNVEPGTEKPVIRRHSVVSKSSGGSKTKQTVMPHAEPKQDGSRKADQKSRTPKSKRDGASSKSSGSVAKTKQTGAADTESKGSATRSKHLPAASQVETPGSVQISKGAAAAADTESQKSSGPTSRRPSAVTEPNTDARDGLQREGSDLDSKAILASTLNMGQQANAARIPAKGKVDKGDPAGNKDRKTRKKK